MRWVMIISTISWGSLVTRDEGVIEASGEALPDHVLQSMARVRYQTRTTDSSIAVEVIIIK
jgi:hypothetical protein